MIIECMSSRTLEYELRTLARELKLNDKVELKITPCKVLKGTFNLEITRSQ